MGRFGQRRDLAVDLKSFQVAEGDQGGSRDSSGERHSF